MSKFAKLIKALALIARQPSLLNNVLNDSMVKANEVKKTHNISEGLKTIQINDLLGEINETVEPFSFLDGGSTPMDLLLLKCLAKQFTECEYFEIGTWRGESVTNVASVAKHCTTLNLPDNTLLEMGMDKNYVLSHRFFSKNLKNITHIQANSLTFDYNTLNKKFDLIFIDGDHHYESVKSDTSNVFQLLKNENSIIVWHDYKNNSGQIRWDVLKGIIDGTPETSRQNIYSVSNTLCAIYLNKKIHSEHIPDFSLPKSTFSLQIKRKRL